MAVPTTTLAGPRSAELEDLDKAIESYPIWTELRGPLTLYPVIGFTLTRLTPTKTVAATSTPSNTAWKARGSLPPKPWLVGVSGVQHVGRFNQ